MDVPEPINAKVVVSGLLECRDKDGNLIKTIPIHSEIPLDLKDSNDDQRSQ